MAKLKVVVTQEHIEQGIPNNSAFCPIALAIKEANPVPGAIIRVYPDDIVIGMNTYPVSDAMVAFIEDFDEGRGVAPFEFELPL